MTTLHTPTPAFTLQINNHPQTPLIRQPTNLPCQLMGVNAASQTDFRFSFRGFARRGGATDIHSHGWGMAFYDGRGLRACSRSFWRVIPSRCVVSLLVHVSWAAAWCVISYVYIWIVIVAHNTSLLTWHHGCKQNTQTYNMVSHIRYATRGEVKLENVSVHTSLLLTTLLHVLYHHQPILMC
jgi:glutamine amidotransferase